MIRKYIQTAMEHAGYEILQDDGTYYGESKKLQVQGHRRRKAQGAGCMAKRYKKNY